MTATAWFPAAMTMLLLLAAGEDGYVGRLQEERAALDRELRAAETTPFTPVAMRMVPVGEEVVVGACDGRPRFDPDAACKPQVRLRYTDHGFEAAGAAGVDGVIPLGRFRLALSRQEDRGRVLVHDPVAPEQRSFRALRWYPPDPAYRFVVRVEPFEEMKSIRMATTAGLFKTFLRLGSVGFVMDGKEQRLSVYVPEGADPSDPAAFFIPFRDATAGRETYPVGRYAGLSEEGGDWILDLNRAGNPNCAYNGLWNCPIPPAENVLKVPVRAGELPYEGSH